MELKYFSLIFSIIGIAALYSMSLVSQPIIVEINQLSDFEGREVTVEGVVVSFFETKYGCQLITIKKDNLTDQEREELKTAEHSLKRLKVLGEKLKKEVLVIFSASFAVSILTIPIYGLLILLLPFLLFVLRGWNPRSGSHV